MKDKVLNWLGRDDFTNLTKLTIAVLTIGSAITAGSCGYLLGLEKGWSGK